MSNRLSQIVAEYPDFPKKGISFKDILPLLQHPAVFADVIKDMSTAEFFKSSDAIISIDSRGFIFGTAISMQLSKPMVVARKIGKLPGELLTKSYELEYGKSSLSIQKNAMEQYQSFVIVDDLLATGGTVTCVSEMIKEAGKDVAGLSVVVELGHLNAKSSLSFPVVSQITM